MKKKQIGTRNVEKNFCLFGFIDWKRPQLLKKIPLISRSDIFPISLWGLESIFSEKIDRKSIKNIYLKKIFPRIEKF